MDIFGNFSKLGGDKSNRRGKKGSIDYSYINTAMEPIAKIETKSLTRSFLGLKVFVVFIFCVLVSRLFFLQVVEGSINQAYADGNRIRPRNITATRGLIMDKNGVVLADNQPSFALAVYPMDLPKGKSDRQNLYTKLATISGMSVFDIQKSAEKDGLMSLNEIDIKTNITHDDALLLEEKVSGMPGVFVATNSLRQYTMSGIGLGHILGYTGIVSEADMAKADYKPSDKTGKSGLEEEYEGYLRGVNGTESIEVDSKGNEVKVLADSSSKAPITGDDLVLNIDSDLQQKTAQILQAGIDRAKQLVGQDITGGVAAVMDVNTGGMLSLVSLPDYDNNLFTTGISNSDYQKLLTDTGKPLYDRSINGVYPPGSISKIILASAGLTEGNITTNTAFDTPPAITVGDYTFPDNKDHGYTDVTRALAESNNIFFYSIGGGYSGSGVNIKGLGIDKIKQWWEKFGLGEPTGIDLPNESSGLLPDPQWKLKVQKSPWYIGDTYHVSIGQGDLLVTPLQMLRATATIANGGKLLEPQLVNKIVDPTGKVVQEFGPRVEAQNFVSSSVIKTVAKGMRMVVTEPTGSAHNLADAPVAIAGKTGTAQFLNNAKTHAWFEGFAPYDNPQIAVIVLVDGGGGGFAIASPIAKDIISYYFTRTMPANLF